MRRFIGKMFSVAGIIGGLYVGGWLMLIKPIISLLQGALSGSDLVWGIVEIIFALSVGGAIAFAGMCINVIIDSIDEY